MHFEPEEEITNFCRRCQGLIVASATFAHRQASIGARIKALIVLREKKINEVAPQLGMTRLHLYGLINGRSFPTTEELHKIVTVLHGSLRWLKTEIGDPLRESPFRLPPKRAIRPVSMHVGKREGWS